MIKLFYLVLHEVVIILPCLQRFIDMEYLKG